jgi:2-keto-4-pentenoate hydratase/2-oxohepta-3-ene-1,7-dioic acid hydratase in catechol pathway
MRVASLAGRPVLLTEAGAVPIDSDDVFADWDRIQRWSGTADQSLAVAYDPRDLDPCVRAPGQIFAIALNYRPHAAEAGYVEPGQPLVFTKFASCLTGAFGAVPLPPGHVDWELEMVAVVGKHAYRVSEADGWDPIVALTVGQDLSERIAQLAGRPAQFSLGKSYPGFGPIGPALVSLDEVADRDDLELTGTLNGEVVQHDRTSNMIFGVPRLVAYLSSVCPLRPGDLIFTGTPAGVGNRHTPPRFLAPGDVLESTIETLGTMRHTFTTG